MASQPMPLSREPAPFDHPDWIFELKYDGFRSLAVIHDGRTQFISRNGHPFSSFENLRKTLASRYTGKTVLDGEIVCVDKRGKPQFNDLLFHRGEPCFLVFDLLMNDGKDLRTERLSDRKRELRRLLSKVPASRMRYVEHVELHGTALFERVCPMDLEGIVANIPRWLAAKNFLSGNVTLSRLLVGIGVTWLARGGECLKSKRHDLRGHGLAERSSRRHC